MERTRPHPPEQTEQAEQAEQPPPLQVSATPVASQGRVRQALRCPYCRDDTRRRDDVVACARSACGALYHRECWEECVGSYGACAVFGCESREHSEVSAWGYLVRLLRLLLAAVLFPPRVVRSIREHEAEGFGSLYRRARARAGRVFRSTNRDGGIQGSLVLFLGVPLSYLVLFAALKLRGQPRLEGDEGLWLLPLLLGGPFLILLLPALAALGWTLGFTSLRWVGRALAREIGLLNPDEQGTFLGRLTRNVGKKPPG